MSALAIMLLLLLAQTQSQPSKICLMGDNGYGNLHPFSSSQDPRVLMGTFTQITPDDTASTLSVDFNSPIYKHKYYDEDKSNYIFKILNVGWVLSESASPNTADMSHIELTCFADNIINCLKYSWFWGYNTNKYPIMPLSITAGACHIEMCFQDFRMTIKRGSAPSNKFMLDGHLTPIARSEDCVADTVVCDSNRTYWINNDDTEYRWYYRVSKNNNTRKNANWVYGKVASDRIACAPGYVEAPLFCTTFVYASNNYTNYTFNPGLCEKTTSPTIQPSNSPSSEPSAAPTPSPSDIPSCDKDYIFNAVTQNTTITENCPFGWLGTSITRYCDMDAMWTTITDDCHLISFTDDFSYDRDELWIDGSNLQSYTSFTYPLRIDFAGFVDASAACGRSTIALIQNDTIGASVAWDCDNITLSHRDVAKSKAIVYNASAPFIDGHILYRRNNNGDITLSVVQNKNHNEIINLMDTEWLSTAQTLSIETLPSNKPRFSVTTLSLTTFIDWFNTANTLNTLSALWTTSANDITFGNYSSASFLDIDPDTNRNYITLSNGGSISSDSTKFQFISPFSVSMLLNRMNDSMLSDITVQLATVDEEIYSSITVSFRITFNRIYVTLDGNEESEMYTDCVNDTELFTTMRIAEHNVSITIYDSDMKECGAVIQSNPAYLASSSLNWIYLVIAPTTVTDIASISYIAAISGLEEEIITEAPTAAPSAAPTRDPDSFTCIDLYNTSIKYFESEEFTKKCDYGYKGTYDTYKCLKDGTFTIKKGCYPLSFGDDFLDFNEDIWKVVEPSSHHVNGGSAVDRNGNGIQLIPDHPAYVSVVRSVDSVLYPLKIRTTLTKTSGECNNWFIAVGESYAARESHSILLKWDCVKYEASLYNSSYRRYDKNCWSSDDAAADENTKNESLDITLTITNSKAVAYFDTMQCANLIVQAADIVQNDVEPYIWFGTHTDNGDIDATTARFSNLLYTQFYSDFNGVQKNIWQNEPSIDTDVKRAVLYGGDAALIAGSAYMFSVPFVAQLGIHRPRNNIITTITDTLIEEEMIEKGRYAHFIVFGDTQYSNTLRENVIQVVYDGNVRQRMIYTTNGVYLNSKGCKWAIFGKTFHVSITIDVDIVSVSDDFCSAQHILYGKHDLDINSSASLMAIGMLSDYGENDFIEFDAIEIYQEPAVYQSRLLVEEEIALSDKKSVADVYNLASTFWTRDMFGFAMLYWVIGLSVILILLCFFICVIAWCLNCWPFRSKNKVAGRDPVASSSPAIHEASQVPHHERFEAGVPFQDEEAEEIVHKKGKEAVNVVVSTDDDEDDADAVNPGANPGANVNVPINVGKDIAPGDNARGPYVHKIANDPGNLIMRNTSDADANAEPGHIEQDAAANNDDNDDDDIDLDDLDGFVTNETQENRQLSKMQKANEKYQRELFWQRQFFEMIMMDNEAQQTLAALSPPQRRLYLEQEMQRYVKMMNTENEAKVMSQIPDDYVDKQMEILNNTLGKYGEGILDETETNNDSDGDNVFDMIKNAHPPSVNIPPPPQRNDDPSSKRMMNQLGMNPNIKKNKNRRQHPKHNSAALYNMQNQNRSNISDARIHSRKNNSASLYKIKAAPFEMDVNVNTQHHVQSAMRLDQVPPPPHHSVSRSVNNMMDIQKKKKKKNKREISMPHIVDDDDDARALKQRPHIVNSKPPQSASMIRLAHANQQHHPPPAHMVRRPIAAPQAQAAAALAPHIVDYSDDPSFMFQPNSMAEVPALDVDPAKNDTFALFHYTLPDQPKLPDGIELEPIDQNQEKAAAKRYLD